MGTGAQIYTMRKSLNQEKNLHDHELALSTEQHFTSLSTELLAIAKEADRDVWEQRNNQFDQMLVCAVLMFGVAVGNINEGTYGFDKYEDQHNGLNAAVVFSRDGMFIILSAIAIASLFVATSNWPVLLIPTWVVPEQVEGQHNHVHIVLGH